jgi:hypothetical protein
MKWFSVFFILLSMSFVTSCGNSSGGNIVEITGSGSN